MYGEGYFIVLCDGQKWAVPAASMLPKKVELQVDRDSRPAATGEPPLTVTSCVKPQFQEFWDESHRWAMSYFLMDVDSEAANEFTYDPAMTVYVYRALRLNYRLTPEIVNHVGLFDESKVLNCIQATLDGFILEDVLDQKKTDAAPIPVT